MKKGNFTVQKRTKIWVNGSIRKEAKKEENKKIYYKEIVEKNRTIIFYDMKENVKQKKKESNKIIDRKIK